MISTVTAAISAKVNRGSGPNMTHATKAAIAASKHQWNEPARDAIRQPLHGGARALRLSNEINNACQHRVAADFVSADHQATVLIDGASNDLCAFALLHRHRLSGHERFIHQRRSFSDDTIDRDLLAGTNTQEISDSNEIDGDVLIAGLDRSAGPSSAQAQATHGSRLTFAPCARSSSTCPSSTRTVITAAASKYTATVPCISRNALRENLRRKCRHDAVDVGDARSHGDQGEHVEIARDQ